MKNLSKLLSLLLAIDLLIAIIIIVLGLSTYSKISTETKQENQIIVSTTLPTPRPEVKSATVISTKVVSDPLISLINSRRKERSLRTLSEDTTLMTAAQVRAKDLWTKQQWSHDGYKEAVEAAGLGGWHKENLARNYTTDKEIVQAWTDSPTHAENMYEPKCDRIGIGRYENYVVLWMGCNHSLK